jgi:hypothetical protein
MPPDPRERWATRRNHRDVRWHERSGHGADIRADVSAVVFVSFFLSFRDDRKKAAQAERRELNARYLNPLRLHLAETRFRLAEILALLNHPGERRRQPVAQQQADRQFISSPSGFVCLPRPRSEKRREAEARPRTPRVLPEPPGPTCSASRPTPASGRQTTSASGHHPLKTQQKISGRLTSDDITQDCLWTIYIENYTYQPLDWGFYTPVGVTVFGTMAFKYS